MDTCVLTVRRRFLKASKIDQDLLQVVDGSPIEVTLAKPVDKDSYVRYTRGTGGRGGSLLQTDYTSYTLGQVSY